MTNKAKRIYKHIGFWLCFWFIQSLLFSGGHHFDFYLVKNIVIVSLQMIVAYFNWHVLFKLISAKRYLLYGLASITIIYLTYSIAYTLIDLALSTAYPEVKSVNPYRFSWVTSFWTILSGSAPYSIALLGSTVFCLIRLNNALSRARSKQLGKEENTVEHPDNSNTLMLKEGKVVHRLNVEDILFVQGMKEYVSWHTKDKKLVTLHSLSRLEEQLGNKGFLRTHKSFIVNTKCVNAIRYDSLDIPGTKIPIGRSYRSRVQSCFQSEI